MRRRHVRSGSPFEEAFGFSRAVRVGNRVLVSGTAPIPKQGEELAATAYDQMKRCAEIIVAALAEVGAAPSDVVRTRMFIADPADADEVGLAHREVFGPASPAATMVVTSLLHPGWRVEAEAEAVVG